MKLENKKQKVASLDKFFVRMLRYFSFACGLIVFSIFLGVFGYSYFGQLDLIDSFHMACMILTGMGPVIEMKTNNAKIFSSLYALYSGIAFLGVIAIFFSPVVHRLLHILHIEDND